MTWASGKKNPLIAYPCGPAAITDFDFVLGSFGATAGKWQALGGTPPTLVAGTTNYAVNFSAAATDSFIYNYHTTSNLVAVPTDSANNQVYIYHFTAGNSGSGAYYVSLFWYDGAYSFFASDDYTWNVGSDIPIDGVKRLYRVAATPNPSAVYYGLAVGKRAAAGTYSATTDWLYYGKVVDFQDLNGITASGAGIHTPYNYKSTKKEDFEKMQYGTFSSRLYNAGQIKGELVTTPFAESDRSKWDKFIAYAQGANQFSLFHNQSDLSSDAIYRCVVAQKDDGIDRIDGSPSIFAKLKYVQALK